MHKLELEMNKLITRLTVNKLSLNWSETKIMFFQRLLQKKQTKKNVKSEIQGIGVERVEENKFLCVIWRKAQHRSNIYTQRCQEVLGCYAGQGQFWIVNPFTFSILHLYCPVYVTVRRFGENYKTSIHSMFILQIHKVDLREHTSMLFLKSKVLKLSEFKQLW